MIKLGGGVIAAIMMMGIATARSLSPMGEDTPRALLQLSPLILPWQTAIAPPFVTKSDYSSPSYRLGDLTEAERVAIAHAITVKFWVADNNWGSGILIQRQGPIYTVLTNRHVVNAGSRYRIETADGQRYEARVVANPELIDYDLVLTQFTSAIAYPVAAIDPTDLAVGDTILAAGYPINDDPSQGAGFTTVPGRVAELLPQTMAGGYQIGAEMAIAKGMSGGPLLNAQGQLVGINGMHQYPIWGNPYVFDDGSVATVEMQHRFERYSWAIPILDFGFWILD
ncbi:MAG: serine protease [Leptolyngbyaceae bacterium]|nr:serine protease [Leptolyngbyaceae bacterium]